MAGLTEPARSLARWFLLGCSVAIALQVLQVISLGGDRTALLSVGTESPLRSLIELELGEVTLVPGPGHDGQMSYLIARNPGGEVGEVLDHAGYRYRRILYPALAGGLGSLSPEATLWGLQIWAVAGMGLATASVAAAAAALRLPPWVILGVVANPGVWQSVQLLTPDVLALGLALAGLALCLEGRWTIGAVLLAASALTKDQYLVTALGLAGWAWWSQRDRRNALLLAVLPGGLLSMWAWMVGPVEGLAVRGNISLPGAGLLLSAGRWAEDGARGFLFATLAALGLAAGTASALLARRSLYAWLTLPWVALGLISSTWVWDHGNNVLRVLAPVWVFATLSLAAAFSERRVAA